MSATTFLDGRVTLYPGDCIDVLAGLPANSVDSIVTDPPYHLTSIVKRFGSDSAAPAKAGATGAYQRASSGFMGKVWDGGDIAFQPATWAAVLRVLKPGGHMVAFSGTRTYHRMAVAIEDAGFEIRDQLAWMYGSGFPKSHDVSKGIDKAAGAERDVIGQAKRTGKDAGTYGAMAGDNIITAPATDAAREWQGWGTALKPAWEPICLARKPLIGTVAANVLEWGTGALNVDGCRVGADGGARTEGGDTRTESQDGAIGAYKSSPLVPGLGRWPANIIHDGSDEVLAGFPESTSSRSEVTSKPGAVYGMGAGLPSHTGIYGFDDSGSAARYFYTAKADSEDRLGSKHPTVKPLDLMQYLCRLVTPPGGTVLDIFAGTGTTGEAAWREGFKAILIEREAEYQADIARRMELAVLPTKRAAVAKTKNNLRGAEGTPLFPEAAE